MTYIAVRNKEGRDSIGSAFHVGEGVFVTARHVVEGQEITEIQPSERIHLPQREVFPGIEEKGITLIGLDLGSKDAPTWPVEQQAPRIIFGPAFHNDERLDVAVFKVEGLHPKVPFVRLGSHLDDWIIDHEFVLTEALVLGYPPIPFTTRPVLVAARAEINAVIDPRHAPKVHFILSAMPRGGFSGGLAVSQNDFALGLITQSLMANTELPELGFMAVLSVEPIYECLADHKILPDCQAEGWDDFWNQKRYDLGRRAEGQVGKWMSGEYVILVTLEEFDDGRRCYLEVLSEEEQLREIAVGAAVTALGREPYERTKIRDHIARITLQGAYVSASAILPTARQAAMNALLGQGLVLVRSGAPDDLSRF